MNGEGNIAALLQFSEKRGCCNNINLTRCTIYVLPKRLTWGVHANMYEKRYTLNDMNLLLNP